MFNVNGQDMPHYTQYMNNNAFFNPASSSISEMMCVGLVHRSQWISFPGEPTTTAISISNFFTSYSMGLGLNLKRDAIGNFNRYYVDLDYSYKLRLSKTIEGGMGLGLSLKSNYLISSNWLTNNSNKEDGAIPYDDTGNWTSNINLGMFIVSNKWFVGLSALNLVSIGGRKDGSKSSPNIYLVNYYNFSLNKKISISPFLNLKSNISSFQFDLGVMSNVFNNFLGGVSYRFQDSFNFLLGYNLNNLSFMYSYDMSISKISYYGSGSHEISIRYCFDIYDSLGIDDVESIDMKLKNVRFL